MPPGPFMIPIQSCEEMQKSELVPPARVQVAMGFLNYLQNKMMTRVAINDISIEEVSGQVPTVDEKNTHSTACQVLQKYFKGNLKITEWETLNDFGDDRDAGECRPDPEIYSCPSCLLGKPEGTVPQKTCKICEGQGKVVIFPVHQR